MTSASTAQINKKHTMDLERLREAIKSDRFEWRKHTVARLAERNISQDMIMEAIMQGEIIEDYPHNTPFPSCLILSWVKGKPYHVVVSFDETLEIGYIITAYEPNLDKFEPDFRTRRR
jgi:hypothetical protein